MVDCFVWGVVTFDFGVVNISMDTCGSDVVMGISGPVDIVSVVTG